MRRVLSERENELYAIISPYLYRDGIRIKLRKDSPEEVHQAFEELRRINEKYTEH